MDCTVLVSSWDGYSDLWKPFFTLFWKYWPDCPFDVALTANTLIYDDPKVRTIQFAKRLDWSSGLIASLKQIDTKYVFIMLEDFFLREEINTELVVKSIDLFRRLNGHLLRAIPNPLPNQKIVDSHIVGEVCLGSNYRVNLQAGIWLRETFLEMLVKGESAWEFEINGTKRSEKYSSGFYSVYKPLLTYGHHVVEKGKWFRNEAEFFETQNIGCDFSARDVMTKKEMKKWKRKKSINKIKSRLKQSLIKPVVAVVKNIKNRNSME